MPESIPKPQKSRAYERTPEMLEQGERLAEEIFKEGLLQAGLQKADLPKLHATDPRKADIAREIWTRITVSQTSIAERLKKRSAAAVSLRPHGQWRKHGHRKKPI